MERQTGRGKNKLVSKNLSYLSFVDCPALMLSLVAVMCLSESGLRMSDAFSALQLCSVVYNVLCLLSLL